MRHVTSILTCSVLLLILTACGGSDDTPVAQTSSQLSTSIPPSILTFLKYKLALTSELRIDNGTPIALSVDLAKMITSGDIGFLSDGEYSLEIRFTTHANSAAVLIASSSVVVDLINGDTNFIVFPPYIYLDDDGDGFTNLAELSSGTAWNDFSDKPQSDYSRYSVNYFTIDELIGNVTKQGNIVSGKAISPNYLSDPER